MSALEQLLFDALDEHRPGMAGSCVDARGAAACSWRPSAGGDAAPFSAQHRDHLARDVIAPLVLEHAATTSSPGIPAPAGHDRKDDR